MENMSRQVNPAGSAEPPAGIIGLGTMGAPMARNMLKNLGSVAVSHRSRERSSPLLDLGAEWASSPRVLAERCRIIVLMLPDLPDVESVLAGADGLIAGVTAPTLLVISSTSSATGIRELEARLHAETRGLVHVIDAPVTGGEEGAIAGTLSILVGGADDDVQTALPVLRSMGTPFHLGGLGAGAIAKFCNQLIVAATVVALGEAAVLGERSGLDLEALFEALGGGYAGSRVLETRKRRFIDGDYHPSGAARFMVKDLGFALAEARRVGVDAQQLSLLAAVFADLTEQGFGDQDISVTRAYVESRSLPRH
jgi:2-hydroxy-3-oxopropionate reductase